ncbi:MAG: RnfABCDGE type electron transport complex subunit B [Planctomycetota bacterium]|jgi:Na+-translocating ferredoxin:NAD+ oxidoreductase RNF subunit RnfB
MSPLCVLLPFLAAAAETGAPMVETVGWGAGIMAAIGGALGLLLFVASRAFAVKVDPRIEKINAALPGVNCGGCGYPGCSGYAEAVVNEGAAVDLCAPGGADCAKAVAEVMGVEFGAAERRVSILACRGTREHAREKYDYFGVNDCRAAVLLHDGAKACRYGCLGLGSCVAVCPFDALVAGEDSIPHVIEELCTACGKCLTACPRDLFTLRSEKQTVVVACASHDPGKIVNKACKVGCIGCRKCEKTCKFDAVQVVDGLPVIDYEKCKNCAACVKACPRGIILNFRASRRARKERQEKAAAGKEG